jgi:hypothetical protein
MTPSCTPSNRHELRALHMSLNHCILRFGTLLILSAHFFDSSSSTCLMPRKERPSGQSQILQGLEHGSYSLSQCLCSAYVKNLAAGHHSRVRLPHFLVQVLRTPITVNRKTKKWRVAQELRTEQSSGEKVSFYSTCTHINDIESRLLFFILFIIMLSGILARLQLRRRSSDSQNATKSEVGVLVLHAW